MQRRSFIRTLGGGTLVAATIAPLSGCSTELPAQAMAAWNGPAPDAELRLWALSHAVLAPSPHNLQPWLVDLREPDAISLYVDRTRLLPMTDPWHRQIMIGQGTFLEILVMALREHGVQPLVQLFPQGPFDLGSVEEHPVARVSWGSTGTQARPDPLFAQVLRRRTAKVEFDTARPVTSEMLAALHAGWADEQVRLESTVDAQRLLLLRQVCLAAAQVETDTPRTMLESLKVLRIGPEEILRHRDGIAVNAWLARCLAALGGIDRTRAPEPGSTAWRETMARYEGYCRTAMGFVWLSTDTHQHARDGTLRHAEVAAGRAYLRLQLQATQLGLQMHPMSQALQEFAEMKPHYDPLHLALVGAPASERTLQMLCRIGHAANPPHSPRRQVNDLVRT